MSIENNISSNSTEEALVEREDLGESKIKVPFDPSEIEVDTATVNLGYLLNQLELGQIDLSPDFQRAADLWDNKKKSRLIESILLGIPIPSFYLSENLKGKLDVIDGLQRLCALKDFVFGKEIDDAKKEKQYLELSDLEFLNEDSNKNYQGLTYQRLNREEQLRIAGYKITTNTIKKGTPHLVKYIIFQRVNTAGEPLTDQEMRHALNQGIPANFVKELAEMDEFKEATQNKIRTRRMEDRDFANRFLGFYLPGNIDSMLDEYKKVEDLNSFLNNTLIKIERQYNESNINLSKIQKDFATSMRISLCIFGDDAFRKRYEKNAPRKPISKSVFDTLSVNIAWLTEQEQETLVSKSDTFKDNLISLFNNPEFNRAISTATGRYWGVETRFKKMRELIHNTIKRN